MKENKLNTRDNLTQVSYALMIFKNPFTGFLKVLLALFKEKQILSSKWKRYYIWLQYFKNNYKNTDNVI